MMWVDALTPTPTPYSTQAHRHGQAGCIVCAALHTQRTLPHIVTRPPLCTTNPQPLLARSQGITQSGQAPNLPSPPQPPPHAPVRNPQQGGALTLVITIVTFTSRGLASVGNHASVRRPPAPTCGVSRACAHMHPCMRGCIGRQYRAARRQHPSPARKRRRAVPAKGEGRQAHTPPRLRSCRQLQQPLP